MKPQFITKCEEHVRTYNTSKVVVEKEKARNELYLLLQPWMEKWISSILANMGKYESREVILSLSWDCFLFCLDRCKKMYIPLPKHFFTYSVYHLKNTLFKEVPPSHSPLEIINEDTLPSINEFNYPQFHFLQVLGHIRSQLPHSYKVVFEDALLSIGGNPKSKSKRVNKSGLSTHFYTVSKRSFTFIIKALESYFIEEKECIKPNGDRKSKGR